MPAPKHLKLLIASSLHRWNDPRIFYKESISLSKKFDISLIAVANKKEFYFKNISITGLKAPRSIMSRIKNSFKICGKFMFGKYDILHFHDPELIWVGFILKFFKKKVVFDIHENIIGVTKIRPWIPRFLQNLSGQLFYWIELKAQNTFDGIILAEESYQKMFKEQENTIVVRNFSIVSKNPLVSERPKSNNIIYVGEVLRPRGIADLVKSVIKIQEAYQDTSLFVIGRAPDNVFNNELNNLIKSSPYPDKFHLIGYVDFYELEQYIKNAKIGVVPLHKNDNYSGSYPTKIFDYMNWGLPFVYSNIKMWEEVFGDSCGGWPFEAGDSIDLEEKIKLLLNDEIIWEKFAQDGRNNIKNFDWAGEEQKLFKLYDSITKTEQDYT